MHWVHYFQEGPTFDRGGSVNDITPDSFMKRESLQLLHLGDVSVVYKERLSILVEIGKILRGGIEIMYESWTEMVLPIGDAMYIRYPINIGTLWPYL